ncbi:MAG: hypothetical protein AB7T63_14455 [Planctomycetota bacterium]
MQPDRTGKPRAPWTVLVLLVALAAGVTYVVNTLRGSEPPSPPPFHGGGDPATDASSPGSEHRLHGRATSAPGESGPAAGTGLRAEGTVVALDLELAASVGVLGERGAPSLLATPVVVFVGNGRDEISFTLSRATGTDGEATVQMDADGRLATRALARAEVNASAGRVSVEGVQLATERAWFVAARSVDPEGRVLEAVSQPVRREGNARTTLLLGPRAAPRGGLVARVRRGGELLDECAVTVREISGLPLGRFRFAGADPEPARLPADVQLRVTVSDARGLKSAGAPAPQDVTLAVGGTSQLEFTLPDVVGFAVRGETPRGEAVPGDLMLWSLDEHGHPRESVPITDALELRGASGWAGRLPPGRYRGVFVPRTEWSRQVFDAEVGEGGSELVLDLGHEDGAALVEVEVLDADGEPLADHRLTFVREATAPDEIDWAHARTDARGEAVLRPLVPGCWQVRDYKRGLARVVDLPAGRSDVRLQMPATERVGSERLEIRALTATGELRPLLNVHVRSPGDVWWRLAFAGTGTAALFEDLAPGTYEVRVPPEWSRYADVTEGFATVLVQEGAGTTRLDVRLARP